MLLIGLQEQPKYMISKIEIIPNVIQQERVFKTFDKSLRWLNEKIGKKTE